MKYRLVGIGELLWDILPGGRALGGAPANFAYHIQSLGGEGIIVSCVGSDDLGQQIFARLDALSLSRRYIAADRSHPTGTVSVKVNAEGKPSYTIQEDVAWDYIPKTPVLMKLANRVDAVSFGTLAQRSEASRRCIQAFLNKARSRAVCIFDLNLRQSFYSREIIESSLKLAHILKLSEEELLIMAEEFSLEGDESELLRDLARQYSLRLVALTKGERGSILYSKGQMSIHHGYKVAVVDTVGAGDSFTASLAMGILKGHNLNAINDFANRVAAFVCSKLGASPELPNEIRLDT